MEPDLFYAESFRLYSYPSPLLDLSAFFSDKVGLPEFGLTLPDASKVQRLKVESKVISSNFQRLNRELLKSVYNAFSSKQQGFFGPWAA
jgi:hypothetical protein